MSNLSQFAGYREIPLIPEPSEPAYFMGSYTTTTYLYSHNHQLMGQFFASSGEFEAGSGWYSQNYSGTPSSSGSWSFAGCGRAGIQGHQYTAPVAGMDSNILYNYYTPGAETYGRFYGVTNSTVTGVWVNKTKRDNLCLQRGNNMNGYSNGAYLNRTCISQLGFGAFFAPISSTGDLTGATTQGVANGYGNNPSYGLIGYNETTRMLVTIADTSSGSVTMYVYKNVTPPTLANANNQTWFSQLNHGTKISVNFTFPSVNDTTDYRHYKIFPLDNGNIAMVYKYASNFIGYRLFIGNNGVDSTSWTMNGSNTVTSSTTTSYHDSNFQVFDALPFLVSYDGKYVFVWTQYYYYLSGICGILIRVSDGQARTITYSDSSYPYSPVMINANQMLISYGVNSDGGTGQVLYSYDLPYIFETTANNSDVTGVRNSPANNLAYTSTNYGMIWSAQSYLPNFIRGVF